MMSKRFGVSLAFIAILAAVWEISVRVNWVDEFLFPSPSQILLYLWKGLFDGSLIDAAFVTFMRLLAGYCIGVILGLPLGLICARFRIFDDTLGMLALGFQ